MQKSVKKSTFIRIGCGILAILLTLFGFCMYFRKKQKAEALEYAGSENYAYFNFKMPIQTCYWVDTIGKWYICPGGYVKISLAQHSNANPLSFTSSMNIYSSANFINASQTPSPTNTYASIGMTNRFSYYTYKNGYTEREMASDYYIRQVKLNASSSAFFPQNYSDSLFRGTISGGGTNLPLVRAFQSGGGTFGYYSEFPTNAISNTSEYVSYTAFYNPSNYDIYQYVGCQANGNFDITKIVFVEIAYTPTYTETFSFLPANMSCDSADYTQLGNYWDCSRLGIRIYDENANSLTYYISAYLGYYSYENTIAVPNYIDLNSSAYQQGYSDGKTQGVISGEKQGYENGYNEGYEIGYNKGFYAGEASDTTFNTLFYSVVNAPVQVLADWFDFEILGMNMSKFVFGLLSLCVVVSLIRLIV